MANHLVQGDHIGDGGAVELRAEDAGETGCLGSRLMRQPTHPVQR